MERLAFTKRLKEFEFTVTKGENIKERKVRFLQVKKKTTSTKINRKSLNYIAYVYKDRHSYTQYT